MSRAAWKGLFLDIFLLKKPLKNKNLYIWSRQSAIPFFLLNTTVFVHTGKIFRKLVITREKIGFKFGAFIKTRTKASNKKLKKK